MSPPRTVLATACALVLAPLTTLALAAGPAAGTPAPDLRVAATAQSTYATSAVQATNDARTQNKLKGLQADGCLKRFAAKQARAMANQQSMYHQDLGPIMRSCGLMLVGENVAMGYSSGPEVVDAWMHSPGHRANILHRGYRLVAVAARTGDDGQWYSAQVFGRR